MHVVLLFPSGTDPRSPHLSLPSLAAHLRSSGIRVTQRDLDLEGLLWLLDPEKLQVAFDQARRRYDEADGEQRGAIARHLVLAGWLIEHITEALTDLRNLDSFLDPDRAHQARAAITAATDLISVADGAVYYSATSAAYEVHGADATRLDDLIRVTGDPRLHLFEDFVRERVLVDLERDQPDLVGISILNRQQVIPGLTLARRLRDAGHRVVLGGTVYAKFHQALLDRPRFFETFCDAVVPYEGETALVAIAEAIANGRPATDLGRLPNTLALDHAGRVTAGPVHVEDVRSLPTPDFTGLPLDDYLNAVPVLPILTGKGCYFNRCKFCDIPYINRISVKPYRVRDPEQVAADVATLHDRHGARHFEITDETLSPKLLLRLGEALDTTCSFEPRFVGYARFEPGFTRDVCERIHAMGMRKLFFGLESGNQAMLDHMDKGIRVTDAHEVLTNCAEAGIAVHVFSIVGFPEETESQARDTLQFLLDARPALDHPRNTFDVHPFGLDLRTEYGDHPDRFGITFDGDPTQGTDFPITLRGWRNSRGLSADEAAALIEEFHESLRSTYRGSRCYPDQQWPGFEEYSIVYGDVYDGSAFPWRLDLPPDGDELRFRLEWAPHVQFEPASSGDFVLVHSFDGVVPLTPTALELLRPDPAAALLGPVRTGTVDEHLTAIVTAVSPPASPDHTAALRKDLRDLLDALLASRAVWLRPVNSP